MKTPNPTLGFKGSSIISSGYFYTPYVSLNDSHVDIMKTHLKDIPQIVRRFAAHGLRLVSPVSVRFWVLANEDKRQTSFIGKHYLNPKACVHTAPDHIELAYEIAYDGMSSYRNWEYTVSNGSMRWVKDHEHGEFARPSSDEEALAIELLGVVI